MSGGSAIAVAPGGIGGGVSGGSAIAVASDGIGAAA